MELFDPAHPGELVREMMEGMREETGQKLTVGEIAEALGTTRKTPSAIINGKQRITPEMAVRLSIGFPANGPEFWLKVQEQYDLSKARRSVDTGSIRVIWRPEGFNSANKPA